MAVRIAAEVETGGGMVAMVAADRYGKALTATYHRDSGLMESFAPLVRLPEDLTHETITDSFAWVLSREELLRWLSSSELARVV